MALVTSYVCAFGVAALYLVLPFSVKLITLDRKPSLMYPKMASDLDKALRKDSKGKEKLCWENRVRIALHTARALKYLHTEVNSGKFVRFVTDKNVIRRKYHFFFHKFVTINFICCSPVKIFVSCCLE